MHLPAILDLGAATPLWTNLVATRGAALTLDASRVERLGAPCLQVLMAAAVSWRADGKGFTIADPSPAFLNSLRLMGAEHLLAAEAS